MIINKTESPTINTTTIVFAREVTLPYTFVEILIVILFAVIFIFGTIGNAFVFYFFGIKKKRKLSDQHRRVPEFLFCVLAVVDFFASAFNPLLYTYWTLTRYNWYFGYWTCKLLVPLGTIATTMSGAIFCILAFDRQRIIVYPFRRHFRLCHIKISIGFVLVYALIVNVHYAVNISLKVNRCSVKDVSSKVYSIPTIIYFFFQDFMLIFVIIFTNCRVFTRILHRYRTTSALSVEKTTDKQKKNNFKVLRLLVTLTSVFFVLTLPRDLFQFFHIASWLVSENGIKSTPATLNLYSFLKVMHVANSCVNPLIYYRMHKSFKSFIKVSLCFKDPKRYLNYSTQRTFSNVEEISLQNLQVCS